jgi:hypothetical protein
LSFLPEADGGAYPYVVDGEMAVGENGENKYKIQFLYWSWIRLNTNDELLRLENEELTPLNWKI